MLTPPLTRPEEPASSQPSDAAQAAPVHMAPWLRYFLIVIALTGVVACTFVWQANDIADIQTDTIRLHRKAAQLEQENARLMVQLATHDSPANIEAEAARSGLTGEKVPSVLVTPVQLALDPEPQPSRLAVLPEQIAGWASLLVTRSHEHAR